MTHVDVVGDVAGQVPEDLYSSWSPSLSPDAQLVAFVSDRGGQPAVWLRALDGGSLTPITLGGRRVVAVSWSPTGEWLAGVVAPPTGSGQEVWLVRPDGSGAHRVAGRVSGTAVLAGGRSGGWTDDGAAVVTETVASSQVLLIRPETGDREVVHEGRLVTAIDISADGRCVLVRRGPRGARQLVVVSGGQEGAVTRRSALGSSESGCLSPDGSTVFACSDVQADLAQLLTGHRTFGRPDRELEEVALSGDGSVAALTWNGGGGLSMVSLLDVATGRQTELAPLPRPVVHGCRLSRDGRVLVLTGEGPTDPKGVWFRSAGADLLPLSSPGRGTLRASRGASSATLEPSEVVAPELHRLRSSDGTEITGWLYRPRGHGPRPTMMWLHGGPEAQERPVYNSLFQTLLADGVAVFAPNVRGSSGFGRRFRRADDGGGRYGAFEDVAACAAHLIDTGVAAPGRLGVSGRSYGGYLTLAVLTRHPELFAVGISVSGMSDLPSWYATTEPWIAAAAVSKYGEPEADAALLVDLSPLAAIDRLRAPLLLVHGAEDTNVPVTQSEQVAAALRDLGVPHRLVVFPGEGHELLATQSRVTFVRAALDWIGRYL